MSVVVFDDQRDRCAGVTSVTRRSAPVLVPIDQLQNERGFDRLPGRRDHQEAILLLKLRTGGRLDSDRSAVELDVDLAAACQPDPIAP